MVWRPRKEQSGVGAAQFLSHAKHVYTDTHAVVDIWHTAGYAMHMAKIGMTPGGYFGTMFAQAIQRKGLTLRALAEKLDYSYEQMRKLYLGTSAPSPLLAKELSKILGMNAEEAQQAATQDRMQRRYGKQGLKALGRDPRLAELDAVGAMLSDAELQTVITVAKGLVKARKQH
jgi:transcriptional regulator with XRE-family HTH domain